MLLTILIILLVLIVIALVIILVVLMTRKKPDVYLSVTTWLIDPNIKKVNITEPSVFELANGESTFFPIYENKYIKGSGQSTEGTKYNFDYKFINIDQLEVYFTSGGIKPANQYIKSIKVSNDKINSDASLRSQDMNGDEYEVAIIRALYSTKIPVWVGQKLRVASNKEFITVPEGSNSIIINQDNDIIIT